MKKFCFMLCSVLFIWNIRPNLSGASDYAFAKSSGESSERGVQNCISIEQLPYDYDNHRYTKTYFEESIPDDLIQTELCKEIKKASRPFQHHWWWNG